MLQVPGLGVVAYSSITASSEGMILLGIMAAEYLRNKEKRSREKTARELLELATTEEQIQLAVSWAETHGVRVDDLRDDEGRPYRSSYRRVRHRRRRAPRP